MRKRCTARSCKVTCLVMGLPRRKYITERVGPAAMCREVRLGVEDQ